MEQSPKIVLPHLCNPHRQYNIHYYCISLVCPWTHLENIADTCWEHTSFSQAYKNVLTVMHKCTWVLLPLNKLIIKLGDIRLYATNIWLVSQWQNLIALLRRTQRHFFCLKIVCLLICITLVWINTFRNLFLSYLAYKCFNYVLICFSVWRSIT